VATVWYEIGPYNGSSTASTITTSNAIWNYWIGTGGTGGTGSIGTSATNTWTVWTVGGGGAGGNGGPYNGTPVQWGSDQPQLTPEQIAERAARQQEEQRAYAVKREEANKRARQLLVENLSATQREQFERDGHFVVHGRQARYRVRQGRSANIDVVDRKGFLSHRLCAHPAEYVPDFDTMLAQKLLLENDEDYFLGRANRHSAMDGRGSAILVALN
jgi:hypothetical protein